MKQALRPVTESADADLVRSVANGDLRALGLLFDCYRADIRRIVARMGVARAEIDDLVQLVFLDVARSAARYDERWPVRSWLYGLTLVLVRRHRRSVSRLPGYLARWVRASGAPTTVDPDESADDRELAQLAARALGCLTAKKREVFVMVVLEEMSCEDVARALGIPVATVWTRLHHARAELRALLKEYTA
jgi:RNA polymerase sigma factor (sigma-70 family)